MSLQVTFGNIESKIDIDDWSVFLHSLKDTISNREEITAEFLKKYLKDLDSHELKQTLIFIDRVYDRKEKYIARIQMPSPYHDDDEYEACSLTIINEKYVNSSDVSPFTLCYITEEEVKCDCCKKCTCDCHN